jgi:hypothetical protein
VSRTYADLESVARLYGVDAALKEHAPVKEGVAGPIREFHEAESFVRVKPFDNPTDRGTGRRLERLAKPGSGAESSGLRAVGVSVEVATLRMTKILISQL